MFRCDECFSRCSYSGFSVTSAFAQGDGTNQRRCHRQQRRRRPGCYASRRSKLAPASRATRLPAANGRYSFSSLRPTTYEIRAELTGFRTVRQTRRRAAGEPEPHGQHHAGARRALGDGHRRRRNSHRRHHDVDDREVVDSKRIVELPLNGRDAARLSTLVAGMVLTRIEPSRARRFPARCVSRPTAPQERQVSFRLDGTSHTDSYFQQNQPFPFPDALQEFSHPDQQLQRGAGQQRGRGGERGHPLRDQQPARRRRSPTCATACSTPRTSSCPSKDFLKRKQFGGYAGGPIQRNKMFFFVRLAGHDDRERRRHAEPVRADHRHAQRRFHHLRIACNAPLRDPLTAASFPNNQIPVSRFDPASVKVMKYMPQVRAATAACRFRAPIGQDDNQVDREDRSSS